jgi:hypothetical protein
MSRLDIAIDPGIRATGVCVAKEGKVVYLGTIRPPVRLGEHRYEYLMAEMILLYWRLVSSYRMGSDYPFLFQTAVVEQFEPFQKNPARKVAVAERAAGCCMGVLHPFSLQVKQQSKRQIKKIETLWLAKDRGVVVGDIDEKKHKQIHDCLDAFQLLVCAGLVK